MESLQYKLEIEGYPCQRPRLGKYGNAYNPPKYTQHKKELAELLKKTGIAKGNYEYVRMHFYFPYPTAQPNKDRVDLAPMNKKYDIDNLVKSFLDAMQDAGIVDNDSMICGIYAEKVFTVEKKGWIEFEIQ